jgi:hypothetical protein
MNARARWFARLACLLAALASGVALAQRATLVRATVDGGGGRATGGLYAATGSFAQADASRAMTSANGRVVLAGGFWPDLRADALFRDGYEDPDFAPGRDHAR